MDTGKFDPQGKFMSGRLCVRAMAAVALIAYMSGCDQEMLNQSELFNPSHLTEGESDIARTFDEAIVLLPGQKGQDASQSGNVSATFFTTG